MHEVIVKHQLQREVAAAHRVTASTVCILCKKAYKNKEFLKDMMSVRDERRLRRQVIRDKVTEMNQLNVFVDSAAFVQKKLLEDKGTAGDGARNHEGDAGGPGHEEQEAGTHLNPW